MPQDRFNLNVRAALLAAIASAYPVIGYSAPVAQVDFAVGNVTAVGSNGQSRTLGKGAQIEQGDTVNTNGGRAQLRFTDGAYVSLQPQSEFRIDQYRYEGKQDGSEKTFVSLLKGGLRTITGFVGRTNKKNYQVATTMATIGIRGTEYTIQYGQSITGTVGEGEIEVCNGAGCLNVTNGESYYVANQDVKPQRSNKGTDLPPDPPPPPPQIREGEHVDESGDPCTLFPKKCTQEKSTPPSPPPPIKVLAGTQTLDTLKIDFCDGVCKGGGAGTTVVFDDKGKLLDFGGEVPATVQMRGNDGIVAWGTFTDSSGFGLLTHFVAGLPVPTSDLANLGGSTATYSLIGATPVTDSSNNTIGTLNSASLTVVFGLGTVGVDMNWTINGAPLSAALTGSGEGGTSFSACGSCGLSCSVNADILLFGANAVRAGMIYDIFDPIRSIDGIGAAALKQTGLVSTPAAKTTP